MVLFKNSWLKSKIFCCKNAYYRKCPRFENAYYWRQITVGVLIRDQVGISGRWGPSVSFVSMTRIGLTGCGPPVCTQVHNKRSTGIMGPHALFHALLSGPQTGRFNKFKKNCIQKSAYILFLGHWTLSIISIGRNGKMRIMYLD